MKTKIDYTLYLVTDRDLMSAENIETAVEQAIKGGCTLVQLREKEACSLEFYEMAKKVKVVTDSYNVPLIINDRVDIALAIDADGVHIGQSDLPAKVVRGIIGRDKILGVSASNLQHAVRACEDGADYIGVGAMFPTDTKDVASFTTMEDLAEIRKAVSVPIVVIGGINKATLPSFSGSGIDGLAVVSAILAQEDIQAAALELKELFLQGKVAVNEN